MFKDGGIGDILWKYLLTVHLLFSIKFSCRTVVINLHLRKANHLHKALIRFFIIIQAFIEASRISSFV